MKHVVILNVQDAKLVHAKIGLVKDIQNTPAEKITVVVVTATGMTLLV